MKAIVKRVDESPEICDVVDLADIRKIIGGYIAVVPVDFEHIVCICDEEGLLKNLPVNFYLHNISIVGTTLFMATTEPVDDFTDLTDVQIDYILNEFKKEGRIKNENVSCNL